MIKIIIFFILFFNSEILLSEVTIPTNPVDEESSTLVRIKSAPTGWTYEAYGIEFETCKLNSIYAKDYDGTDKTGITLKLYKSDETEITTQADADLYCAKTVVDWEPPYDYEIIGGFLSFLNTLTGDVRIWLVGVPDIPEGSGGSKQMISTLNFRYLPNYFTKFDGRSSKKMVYDATNHTNKLRIIIKVDTVLKEKAMMVFEHYKQ